MESKCVHIPSVRMSNPYRGLSYTVEDNVWFDTFAVCLYNSTCKFRYRRYCEIVNTWRMCEGDFQPCLGGCMTTSMYFQRQPRWESQIQNWSCRSFPFNTINKRGKVDEYKRLKLAFYNFSRFREELRHMFKLMGDECICFCVSENFESPLTIRRKRIHVFQLLGDKCFMWECHVQKVLLHKIPLKAIFHRPK